MLKSLVADFLIGTLLAGIVAGVLVPNVPAQYRGPQGVLLVWLGVTVLYSVVRWRMRRAP